MFGHLKELVAQLCRVQEDVESSVYEKTTLSDTWICWEDRVLSVSDLIAQIPVQIQLRFLNFSNRHFYDERMNTSFMTMNKLGKREMLIDLSLQYTIYDLILIRSTLSPSISRVSQFEITHSHHVESCPSLYSECSFVIYGISSWKIFLRRIDRNCWIVSTIDQTT